MNFFKDFEMLMTPSGEVFTEQAKPGHMDAWMQHCVVGVMGSGKSKENAFAICTNQGQKSGYYELGTRTLTDKGKAAVKKKAAKPAHDETTAEYMVKAGGKKKARAKAQGVEEATSTAHDRIKQFYVDKGLSETEAEDIARKTLAKRRRSESREYLSEEGEKFIAKAIKKKGALRRYLGVKEGEKIPTKKLYALKATLTKKAEGDKTLTKKESTLLKRVTLALTLRGPKVPAPKREDTLMESREGFMQWVSDNSRERSYLAGERRVFTMEESQGASFLREASRRGAILEHFPGRNLVRVRFGDGDMMLRRNRKGYAIVVPGLGGAGR